MARGIALLSLASLLLSVANGQKPGEAKEVHPKVTTYRCSKRGGCKASTNYVVLDSLAHPVHQAGSTLGCGDWGNKPNATACPDKESCAKNCIMEGIPDYSKYGVTTKGSSLRLQQLLDGKLVSPRVYLLDKTENRYEMLHLTGNEFTFDVDATKLPCGMNSALYLSEMDPTGARSKLNPGGAYYGTGYCDAQCFVTPFINGEVSLPSRHTFRPLNPTLTPCPRATSRATVRAVMRWTSGRPTLARRTSRRTRATSPASTCARVTSAPRPRACATRTAARGTRTAST